MALDFTYLDGHPVHRQRAREILDELRRRAGDFNRPQLELDYIDRLLRRF